jgi:hypothetical protein
LRASALPPTDTNARIASDKRRVSKGEARRTANCSAFGFFKIERLVMLEDQQFETLKFRRRIESKFVGEETPENIE